MTIRQLTGLMMAIALVLSGGVATSSAASAAPNAKKFANCKALNKKYPHGVGKRGAKDRTSSAYKVTNFKRSNALYKANKKSDRDKDGIACEKR